MLCSTSTSGRSTSNWLDKLRSSKGFPLSSSSTDLDLEQFINNLIPPNNEKQSDPKPSNGPQSDPAAAAISGQPTEQLTGNPSQEKQVFSMTSNVLAELFIMGDTSTNIHPKKKCSRKQTNPKFCVPMDPLSDFSNASATNNYCAINDRSNENAPPPGKNDNASPMSDDNSGVGLGGELFGDPQVKLVENVNCAEEEEEKDKGYSNLSGFSRTEVTVIDTSFATWKFEKLLFRKKNVWKVRDRKGKVMSSGKKKRKASKIDGENVCGIDQVKKPKILDGHCGLSKKGGDGAFKEEYQENDKSRTTSRKTSDTSDRALKKKQATLNVKNGSSSVVLIKNIPSGRITFAENSLEKKLLTEVGTVNLPPTGKRNLLAK